MQVHTMCATPLHAIGESIQVCLLLTTIASPTLMEFIFS
jgi:hypothetical protein